MGPSKENLDCQIILKKWDPKFPNYYLSSNPGLHIIHGSLGESYIGSSLFILELFILAKIICTTVLQIPEVQLVQGH